MALTILILGGYGFFGGRLAQRLARTADLDLIIAGRNLHAAQSLAGRLASSGSAHVSAARIDAMGRDFAVALRAIAPHVLVNASGPFQGQSYSVAQACIAARTHYIDLADGREFVAGIGALDERARRNDVLVVSGASTVPALSSAVVDELAKDLVSMSGIDIGISPANKTERGLATVRSILSYCGAPISTWCAGRKQTIYGWSDAIRYRYPAPVGARWLSRCDVPDLELFPQRYPQLDSVTFRAGLELPVLHFGMTLLALCRRLHLVRDWSRYARPLKTISDGFRRLGSDAGAMHVEIRGIDRTGASIKRRWLLIARNGDGPFVPTLATAALIHKLANGKITARGAIPCVGLLALHEIITQADGLAIETRSGA